MFIILKLFARFNTILEEYIQIFVYKKVLLMINKDLILRLILFCVHCRDFNFFLP